MKGHIMQTISQLAKPQNDLLLRRGRQRKVSSGSSLKERRIAANLTQVDVAKAIGMASMTYSKLETGAANTPSLESIFKLLRFFECSFEELFWEVEEAVRAGQADGVADIGREKAARGE